MSIRPTNLLRFSPDIRERAARFEQQIGVLSLSPDRLTVDAIDTFEAEIQRDFRRIANLPGVSWHLSQVEGVPGHPLSVEAVLAARERHYAATKSTLRSGDSVHLYSAQDHWDELRRDLGSDLIVNGNEVWSRARSA